MEIPRKPVLILLFVPEANRKKKGLNLLTLLKFDSFVWRQLEFRKDFLLFYASCLGSCTPDSFIL